MTGLYDWNPMPHVVSVKCPDCAGLARFEFAEIVKIDCREDLPFFQNSSLFEYRRFQDSCGHYWHAAIYYPSLHGDGIGAISDLPAGYSPADWSHSRYLRGNCGPERGAVSCTRCHLRRPHTLNWPQDAFYSATYKGQLLWAFDRESALELAAYIGSKSRAISQYRWGRFLLHVPTAFKSHKARYTIQKQLGRLLEA